MIKLGIIGAGAIAKVHAEAVQLAAAYDLDYAQAKEFAKQHNCKAYKSYSELLNNVDAVIITTPNNTHAELGIKAAKAKKHVLVEKPLAVKNENAELLIKECKKHKVKLGVIFQRRYDTSIKYVKKLIEKNNLGKILKIKISMKWHRDNNYYSGWKADPKKSGGGVLMLQGIHFIDLLLYLLGKPVKVQGKAKYSRELKVEDTMSSRIEFDSGAIGLLECTTAAEKNFPETIEVIGTKGKVKIVGRKVYNQGIIISIISKLLYKYGSHKEIIKDFIDSIKEDREPFVNGEQALKTLKVVNAIYGVSK